MFRVGIVELTVIAVTGGQIAALSSEVDPIG